MRFVRGAGGGGPLDRCVGAAGGFPRRRDHQTPGALARIALANRILRHYGLKLGDFEGQSYVLRSATGRTELVPHLAGMWSAADRLAGRPCDPLAPELIAALERD